MCSVFFIHTIIHIGMAHLAARSDASIARLAPEASFGKLISTNSLSSPTPTE
jgi:hypothetical protein